MEKSIGFGVKWMNFKVVTSHWASFLHFSESPFPSLSPRKILGKLNKIMNSNSAFYQDAGKVKLLAPFPKINLKGATERERVSKRKAKLAAKHPNTMEIEISGTIWLFWTGVYGTMHTAWGRTQWRIKSERNCLAFASSLFSWSKLYLLLYSSRYREKNRNRNLNVSKYLWNICCYLKTATKGKGKHRFKLS